MLGLDRLTTPGLRMICSFDSSTFGPANWDSPSSSSKFSSRRTEFKLDRTYHLPAGTLNIPGCEKIPTSGWRIQFFVGKFQRSGQRIKIYIAETGSYLLERLSSTLAETIIFRPEDSMPQAWGKFSPSSRRMQFLLRKFQLSGQRIEIYLAESGGCLLERLSSLLVETHISRLEDSILCLGEIVNFRSENDAMLSEKYSTSAQRIHRLQTSRRKI